MPILLEQFAIEEVSGIYRNIVHVGVGSSLTTGNDRLDMSYSTSYHPSCFASRNSAAKSYMLGRNLTTSDNGGNSMMKEDDRVGDVDQWCIHMSQIEQDC
jgi:hypothetical protein